MLPLLADFYRKYCQTLSGHIIVEEINRKSFKFFPPRRIEFWVFAFSSKKGLKTFPGFLWAGKVKIVYIYMQKCIKKCTKSVAKFWFLKNYEQNIQIWSKSGVFEVVDHEYNDKKFADVPGGATPWSISVIYENFALLYF